MSAGSRGATQMWRWGAISSTKKLIAAQRVARNLQGGCGWEFPCRQNIAKLIANRILNKLQSLQKKGHTKITGKAGGFGVFFTSVGLEDLLLHRGWGDRTLLGMAPLLTLNQKTFSTLVCRSSAYYLWENLIVLWSTFRQRKLCSFSLCSTQVSLILVQATALTLVLDSCYLQK